MTDGIMTEQAPQTNIATLSELLTLSGSQYRLFDIGRLITKLSKEQFEKVELNQVPYPFPVQGHACFAIAFWQKSAAHPYLWLFKLPLDERGLLNQGARNHLIAIIIEALGTDLTQETSKEQADILNSNPYLLTPAQYKLASLNSKLKVDLKQQPSEYFLPFFQYIEASNWSQWQNVGVQGITDFIARIHQNNHEELFVKALSNLPDEVLSPACSALENEQLPLALIDALINELQVTLASMASSTHVESAVNNPNNEKLNKSMQLVRALAASSDHPHVKSMVQDILKKDNVDVELLITLSGRCWQVLADKKMLMCYFEQLLKHDDLSLFASIFKDLVSIPLIRPVAFECIRSEDRSPALANAIGQLFRSS